MQFVKDFMAELHDWMGDTRGQITHDRVRLTVGVGFCAYKVVAKLAGRLSGRAGGGGKGDFRWGVICRVGC